MPRIVRKELPPDYKNNYRRARPYLRRDFHNRCAYCMTHEDDIGCMHFSIDHFRPQSQGGSHSYDNLYYCCLACNSIKRDTWPSEQEAASGLGFCDPCTEWDYGVHFVERDSGWLRHSTACGEYHVCHIDLNRVELVEKRNWRTELIALADKIESEIVGQEDADDVRNQDRLRELRTLRRRIDILIPHIPQRISN